MRIELPAVLLGFQNREHLVDGHAFAIDAVTCHRVPRIRNRHDAREERDLFARQPVRVAIAVPTLVMPGGDLRERTEAQQRPHDCGGVLRVLLHYLVLVLVERGRLVEHRVGNPDLAQIVDECAAAQHVESRVVESETSAQLERVAVHPTRMSRGVAIFAAERVHQALERLQKGVFLRDHQLLDTLGHVIDRVAE